MAVAAMQPVVSVTHFEGDTPVANIRRLLHGEEPEGTFDGHATCFIETGLAAPLLLLDPRGALSLVLARRGQVRLSGRLARSRSPVILPLGECA